MDVMIDMFDIPQKKLNCFNNSERLFRENVSNCFVISSLSFGNEIFHVLSYSSQGKENIIDITSVTFVKLLIITSVTLVKLLIITSVTIVKII